MNRSFLYLVVFVSGMAVMAVELTAVRLLSPHFGSSLFVWTGVIGVVLAALSAGYWLGGRSADRIETRNLVGRFRGVVSITGALILLVPVVSPAVFALAAWASPSSNLSVLAPSLIAGVLLFAPPLIPAGMVTPLAAKIAVSQGAKVGTGVGSIFLISTLGSLVGTFLPVLGTIPYLGSRATFLLFGGVLLLIGLAKRGLMAMAAALGLIAAATAIVRTGPKDPGLLWEGESAYQHLKVREDFEGTRVLEVNEGRGMQSVYHPRRFFTGYYWDFAAVPPAIFGDGGDVADGKDYLFVGLGGATGARLVHHLFPHVRLEGVEIDPKVVDVGRRFFGMGNIPLSVTVADARVFLTRTRKMYDFLMVDVYRDNRAIPPHLATREFFDLARSRLTSRGILLMNVSVPPRAEALLEVIRNTLAAVFPFVYEVQGTAGSRLLFGFLEPPGLLAGGMTPVAFDSSKTVATDDRSPVELLGARVE